eukprot:1463570-Amphidinium_carterae.1
MSQLQSATWQDFGRVEYYLQSGNSLTMFVEDDFAKEACKTVNHACTTRDQLDAKAAALMIETLDRD